MKPNPIDVLFGELLTRFAGCCSTRQRPADPMDDAVAIGRSGFGLVAIRVAYQRGAAPSRRWPQI
jgi:hypothetical protein